MEKGSGQTTLFKEGHTFLPNHFPFCSGWSPLEYTVRWWWRGGGDDRGLGGEESSRFAVSTCHSFENAKSTARTHGSCQCSKFRILHHLDGIASLVVDYMEGAPSRLGTAIGTDPITQADATLRYWEATGTGPHRLEGLAGVGPVPL